MKNSKGRGKRSDRQRQLLVVETGILVLLTATLILAGKRRDETRFDQNSTEAVSGAAAESPEWKLHSGARIRLSRIM